MGRRPVERASERQRAQHMYLRRQRRVGALVRREVFAYRRWQGWMDCLYLRGNRVTHGEASSSWRAQVDCGDSSCVTFCCLWGKGKGGWGVLDYILDGEEIETDSKLF